MPMPISDAHDINTLLNWVMGRHRHDEPVTLNDATDAARRLAAKANKALMAGPTQDDVLLVPREADAAEVARSIALLGEFETRQFGDCIKRDLELTHSTCGTRAVGPVGEPDEHDSPETYHVWTAPEHRS
jgi:hypothetical protein